MVCYTLLIRAERECNVCQIVVNHKVRAVKTAVQLLENGTQL